MVKGAKTIAEYAIRKWMHDHEFVMSCFTLEMNGNTGRITDTNGERMYLIYKDGEVFVEFDEEVR